MEWKKKFIRKTAEAADEGEWELKWTLEEKCRCWHLFLGRGIELVFYFSFNKSVATLFFHGPIIKRISDAF